MVGPVVYWHDVQPLRPRRPVPIRTNLIPVGDTRSAEGSRELGDGVREGTLNEEDGVVPRREEELERNQEKNRRSGRESWRRYGRVLLLLQYVLTLLVTQVGGHHH